MEVLNSVSLIFAREDGELGNSPTHSLSSSLRSALLQSRDPKCNCRCAPSLTRSLARSLAPRRGCVAPSPSRRRLTRPLLSASILDGEHSSDVAGGCTKFTNDMREWTPCKVLSDPEYRYILVISLCVVISFCPTHPLCVRVRGHSRAARARSYARIGTETRMLQYRPRMAAL